MSKKMALGVFIVGVALGFVWSNGGLP